MAKDTTKINKQIAKNTIALYFRTFITMIVGIYTSRVLIDALGIEDYGINAVVGGIIGMSTLITATISQAISRYLTFSLGQGEAENLSNVFSTAINAQIIISLLAALFLEVVGVWFLNSEANIPEGRMEAANWLMQCSIIILVIGLISSPLSALIVAHERMNIYAYTSIADAILKLLLCYILISWDKDRLILFGILNVLISITMFLFYSWYVRKNFKEGYYNPRKLDKALLKELTAFSGWNMFSQVSWTLNTQGISMLINVFFGVIYNAAQGVAMIVNGCVENFVSSFMMAFNPQIIKNYASKDYSTCYRLVNRGCRFSWMLMLVFVIPIFIEADMILSIWLKDVPDLASLFLRFVLISALSLKLSDPLHTLIQADGKIKRYALHTSIYGLTIFPITWILYQNGAPVWSTYIVTITVRLFTPVLRLYHLNRITTYQWRSFVSEVAIPCMAILFIALLFPLILTVIWEDSIIRAFVLCPVSVLWTIMVCIIIGLTKHEREFFWNKTKTIIQRIHS